MQSLGFLPKKVGTRIPGLRLLFARTSSKSKKNPRKIKRTLGDFQPERPMPRKALRVERPGFADRFRRGEAPMRAATVFIVGFYAFIGVSGAVMGNTIDTVQEGVRTALATMARGIGFGINEVRVAGGSRLTNQEIGDLLGLNHNASAFTLDVNAARARILDIPWISKASVRMVMPGTLEVTVTEREPYALWQRGGAVMMIDKQGHEIGPYSDTRFSSLPLVIGAGADSRAKDLFEQLAQYPALQARTRAAIFIANRRWNLKFADGVDVKLPENNFSGALQTLAQLDKDSGLLNRDIAAVDLRMPDRVVVRMTESATEKRNDVLKARAKSSTKVPRAPTPAATPQHGGRPA